MKNLAVILLVAAVASIATVRAQINGNSGMAANIPGAQTASAFMASASDGMSRYLAPNGPIQPAITAISGLPLRAGEMVNGGITSISSGFNNGGQRMSQAAGQGGQIRMPGMDTAASMMPGPISSLGGALQGMIQSKNRFIMGQAERGVEAANRMGQNMQQGLN